MRVCVCVLESEAKVLVSSCRRVIDFLEDLVVILLFSFFSILSPRLITTSPASSYIRNNVVRSDCLLVLQLH